MKALTPDVSHLRAFSGAAGNPLGTTRLSAMQHIACTKHAAPQSTRIRVWLRVGEDAMTYTIHALKTHRASSLFASAQRLLSIKLVCWKAWVGRFILLTQPGAVSSFQSLISSWINRETA